MQFDEYVTVSDASKEVEISPILSIPPTVMGLNKHVIVHIPDTLLEDNTTYRISFGKAIKDLHEGNPFSHYTYTFSTGSYFDSLQISGTVLNAATGLPDTSIYVLLYSASSSDSAVVREKPKYVGKVDANGSYSIKGLPARRFRVYAIKDANENLIYDGPPAEMVGFYEKTVTPGDSSASMPIDIRVFPEVMDSNLAKKLDTTSASSVSKNGTTRSKRERERERENFSYVVSADTSNIAHRTQDINLPVDIAFSRVPVLSDNRIAMTYDSSGTPVETPIKIYFDTTKKPDSTRKIAHVKPDSWHENTVYTLKLMKGFAKDTGGVAAMPSRYTFRTMREEDYGKILVHLPTRYNSTKYILMVMADNDTIYQKPVTDTMVQLVRLRPATYTFRIIVDENGNGKWDTGNLFAKKQPEEVIPYNGSIKLRANWEHTIDYETAVSPHKNAPQNGNSPPHK